jgi:PAS domain S-box-containing protein
VEVVLRTARSPFAVLPALIVALGVGGYLLTSMTIRDDRDAAAARRAQVEAVHAQEVLGRARSYVVGLADVLAGESRRGQARFARLAGGTSASVGLDDVLWVQRVRRSERRRYERLHGVAITRLMPSGRFRRAPPAAAYFPATFTSRTRPELRQGVDVATFPGLGAALRDRARIFAVGASRPGSLGSEPGFYLLEAAAFAGGPDSSGYLVAFVPRGWFTSTFGGDPRRVAISEDGRRIDGSVDSVHATAGFETLGRRWRIDVAREPPSGLQSTLPWMVLAWPLAAAAIASLVGYAITQRRRAEGDVERVFELSLDLLGIIGVDGRYRAVNPSFQRTLGYSAEEMRGRHYLDIVHPDDRESTRHAFADIVGGEDVEQFEIRCLRADGSVRWLQWSARAVPHQGVIYATARDVTERRRVDAELREAQRTAEARGAELRVRAREQAALRQVATLVAREASQAEVFTAIAQEIGQLLGTEQVRMLRYEDDGSTLVVASAGNSIKAFPVGAHVPLGGENAASRVFRTGRPVRIDDYSTASGQVAEEVRAAGIRSVAATPIVVEGRLWGAMVAATTQDASLPPETETRLGQFTELMATAIANTESRAKVERLADEQAALRRVATLVAEGASPSTVLDAVAAEMERALGADGVTLSRYAPSEEVVVVAHRGSDPRRVPAGTRVSHQGENVTSLVRRSMRAARMEHDAGGPIVGRVHHAGVRASVGAPIVVDGRLWGVAVANWRGEQSPPGDTEQRMAQFAELLDTAIANADSRAQLTASRARLVTEADDARRRVVRDLHDGAQQRLVHTIVTLKLAQRAILKGDTRAESLLREALAHAEQGNRELRELAHGILPAALTRGGLRAGVDAVVERLDLPVHVKVPVQRFPAEIEASTYFIVAEALTNVVKHSHAASAEVTASVVDGLLHVEVRDDGIGGADPEGHGLVGMADRVTALGGRLAIESPSGGGTRVAATLPLSGG